jgi:hypothetical protein
MPEEKKIVVIAGSESGDIVDTTIGGEKTANQRIRKQLTTANVLGRVTHDMIPEKGEPPKWVINIYGQVESFEKGVGTYGEFIKLGGEFIWTNLLTGEEIDGPVSILPGLAEMVVKNQFKAVGFGEPGGPRAIVFAMDIGIEWNKPDEQIIDGKKVEIRKHAWAVRPVGQRAKTPLRLLKEQMEKERHAPRIAEEQPNLSEPTHAPSKKK